MEQMKDKAVDLWRSWKMEQLTDGEAERWGSGPMEQLKDGAVDRWSSLHTGQVEIAILQKKTLNEMYSRAVERR